MEILHSLNLHIPKKLRVNQAAEYIYSLLATVTTKIYEHQIYMMSRVDILLLPEVTFIKVRRLYKISKPDLVRTEVNFIKVRRIY